MSLSAGRTMSGSDWLTLLVLSVLWGSNFLMMTVAVTAIPALTMVAGRAGLASVLLVAVIYLKGQRLPRDPDIWMMFLVAGIAGALVPIGLNAWAMTTIPSSLGGILNATTPLFGVVLAQFLTDDEKLTTRTVVGILFGFCGVMIMMGIDAVSQSGSHIAGMLAVLMSSAAFAYSAVYGKRFAARGVQPLTVATGQIIVATLVAIPMALVIDRPWTIAPPGLMPILSVVAQAIGPTALAFFLLYRFIRRAGAVNLTLVTFLIPVTAIILGALVLNERLSAHHFLGMAAIAVGLAVIDGRPFAWIARAGQR